MKRRGRQLGLTLVEVLLAMAISAMVLAALTQLQDAGAKAAIQAALTAEASLLCQSEMDGWLAGAQNSVGRDSIEPIEGQATWSRRIRLQPAPVSASELQLLTVEVFRSGQSQPAFQLSRWISKQAIRGPAQGAQP
jgi:prepilin-type N-terminal cleavage/methylation domain-containing protein